MKDVIESTIQARSTEHKDRDVNLNLNYPMFLSARVKGINHSIVEPTQTKEREICKIHHHKVLEVT